MIVVVVLASAVIAWWSRDLWFHADIWDPLAMRQIGDPDDLLRPHNGHWQTPTIIQTRVLYTIAGMDFWPVHYLPRTLWWALMSIGLWWLMRRRGADPLVALGGVAIVSVLATSFYFQAAHAGALIAIMCTLAAGSMIEAIPQPRARHQFLLGAVVMAGTASAGIGVAAMVSLPLALLLLGKLRRWWWPILAVIAVYGVWFLRFGSGKTAATPVRTLIEIPWGVVVNARNAVLAFTGLPVVAAWPVLVVALLGVGWLVRRRRVTAFDVIVVVAALVYLALLSRGRQNLHRAAVATITALLLLPVAIPHIRLQRGWMRPVAALTLATLTVSHALRLESRLESRTGAINQARPVVESMAALIANGEQFPPELRLSDLTSSQQLTLGGLADLVEDGWDPRPPEAHSEATVRLRVSFTGRAPEGAAPPVLVAGRVNQDGCAVARRGTALAMRVTGLTKVVVSAQPKPRLEVVWASNSGSGEASLHTPKRRGSRLYLFGPQQGATITLSAPNSGMLKVCGVVAEPP
ncbi:MAG TPA: hypothetical protein VGC11_04775 [Acidimicrobiia bacterium]